MDIRVLILEIHHDLFIVIPDEIVLVFLIQTWDFLDQQSNTCWWEFRWIQHCEHLRNFISKTRASYFRQEIVY